jgi:hypothetical protein
MGSTGPGPARNSRGLPVCLERAHPGFVSLASMCAVFAMGVLVGQNQPSVASMKVLDAAARERILDSAFGRPGASARPTLVSFWARFLPSFHPECQIEVTTEQGSGTSIIYSEANISLNAAARLVRPGRDERAIADAMHVRVHVLHQSEQYGAQVITGLWRALAESSPIISRRNLERSAQLDGTEYLLRYQAGFTSLSLLFQDAEVDSAGAEELPLCRWMAELRRQLRISTRPGGP